MAYKLAVLEILGNLFVLAYIACPRYPYMHIESTDSMIQTSSCHSWLPLISMTISWFLTYQVWLLLLYEAIEDNVL